MICRPCVARLLGSALLLTSFPLAFAAGLAPVCLLPNLLRRWLAQASIWPASRPPNPLQRSARRPFLRRRSPRSPCYRGQYPLRHPQQSYRWTPGRGGSCSACGHRPRSGTSSWPCSISTSGGGSIDSANPATDLLPTLTKTCGFELHPRIYHLPRTH